MDRCKQAFSGICGYRRLGYTGLLFSLTLGLLLQGGCRSATQTESPDVVTPTPVPPVQEAVAPAETPADPIRVEPVPQTDAPRITFTSLVHDFGEISPSSKQVCEFRFQNAGTATLTLNPKIDSTCGCTVPALSRVNYGPGQSGTIKVTYSAAASIGSIQKSMTVHCNDPQQPEVRLVIKAKIVQRVACEPQRLELRLKDVNAACVPITLRSQDGRPFSIAKITCSGEAITVPFDPSLQANTFTLDPRVDVEKLEKRPVGYLLLDVTHPECKQVRIQYNTLREFQFKPAYVMAFNVEPNEPVVKEVDLVNNYGEAFNIESVSSQRGIAKLITQEKQAGANGQAASYRLKLSLTPPANLQPGRMFVDILTVKLADGKEIKLNCRGVSRRQGVSAPVGTAPVRRR